jgi:hypothetical protein
MSYTGVALNGSGELIDEVHAKFNGSVGIFCDFGTVRRSSATSNGLLGMEVSGTVVEGNSADGNGSIGIKANISTVLGNTLLNNGFTNGRFQTFAQGLSVQQSIYGSNKLYNNSLPGVKDLGGNTTQNNNNCDGTTC